VNQRLRVLVTGGASGIGAAAVERFRAGGATVAALDRDRDRLTTVAADTHVVADVSVEAEVDDAVRHAVDALSGLDVIVNCAGVSTRGSVVDTRPEDWDRVFAINVRGTYLCSKVAVPYLRRAGGGAIVNIASQLGLVGATNAAAYSASKGAIIALTRAMAVDHGPEGIRVNCVCPGPTATPLAEAYLSSSSDPEAERRAYEAMQLHGRMITPAEIGEAIYYLGCPAAASTMGATLVVDGGYTIR
jgi:NAD(P)-dependent dehydrogenase (short-subunit alcohol dehydrogenase family)